VDGTIGVLYIGPDNLEPDHQAVSAEPQLPVPMTNHLPPLLIVTATRPAAKNPSRGVANHARDATSCRPATRGAAGFMTEVMDRLDEAMHRSIPPRSPPARTVAARGQHALGRAPLPHRRLRRHRPETVTG
jgi:hypothetical protein